MRNDRRSFLKLAASATALSVLPPNLRAVLADPQPSKTGTIDDVEHVVIFMQENRSFDHYFGTLRGVRGFNDPRAIMLPGGKPVWYQPNGKDVVTPFHLDTTSTSAQSMHSLDHSWKGSHDLWKNHDAWIPAKTEMTMGYFTRADLPFYHALADAFTICDAYHCSVFGPTSPNRLHLFTGTSGLTAGNEEPTVVINPPDEPNEAADMSKDAAAFKAFTWKTYAERLQDAGIDWRVYQEYDNYGDNALAYFETFRGPAPANDLHRRARLPVAGSDADNAKTSRGEHLVAAFAKDVAEDRLPQVSWIVAPYIMCEHPTACPSYGESLASRLLDALSTNPKVWAKTAFILNYDENDGFFDHVPPPIPPITPEMGASTVDVTGETYRGTPFGLGPRVPMIVVSPWTVGGFVNSQVFDHTSVIRFLEVRFGVREPNISAWRRVVSGDLVSVFDFTQTGGAGSLPKGDDGIARADAQAKLPTARHVDEALPRQEPGQRPARALPYNLDVIANFGGAGSTLVFYNTGRAGAVFRVSSARIGEGPWFFTLESGTSLEHRLDPNSSYDLTVHGPNGFFRRFAGPVDSPLQMALHHNGSGELQIIVRNTGVADAVLSAQDGYAPDVPMNAAISPGTVRRLHLPSASRANWYDIKIDGPDGFLRHFAGHIETGAASMSDPHLG